MKAPAVNYALEMERQLSQLGEQPPALLLHCCCAPCASAVLEQLDGRLPFDVLYDNPNISPKSEYEFRLRELQRLVQQLPLRNIPKVLESEYAPQSFLDAVKGLEKIPEGGARCEACFRLRLENTARRAKQQGYGIIATTLTISPLKNAAVLNNIGMQVAQENGLIWLMSDFKKKNGYRRSVELSAQYGLYRQDYCGCAFSKAERQCRSQ